MYHRCLIGESKMLLRPSRAKDNAVRHHLHENMTIEGHQLSILKNSIVHIYLSLSKRKNICHIYAGSWWAFSAVAAIEGIAEIRSGVLASLSEQHILDCNAAAEGCLGGRMEHVYEFVMQNGGLASDTDYPYQTSKGTCRVNVPSSLAVTNTGYERVPPNNETAMLLAVAKQPVSVAIDPSLFQFYQGGVLTGPCGNIRTHAVTAVGYGTS
ncbi:Stem bromelain [Handroanthus impetiginosus]|uniref:Stem bromelain n=1 Tax=Handroanthus impetiginosus TaxID=429701 RepID=A0A2G9I0L5_9LAMI|nr:Stem bromelain [Handroanthus impetiginosus]